MKSLNMITWGDFRVDTLFDIHPTKAYKLTNKELFDGGLNPVVVNSSYNNGIGGTTTLPPTEKGNMITFSDTVDANTIFYQENSFIGYPHVQGLYPKGQYKDQWTSRRLQFFSVLFRKTALIYSFDFGNKFRRDIALKLNVKLPVTANGKPDFAYMDSYISSYDTVIKKRVDILQTMWKKTKIDFSSWHPFHLFDKNLFDINSGTKLDKVRMTNLNPSVNFIGRANANNGITDFIDEIAGLKPYDSGLLTISLGGEYLGSCFVQDKPFYTSQNVNVLIPRVKMSYYAKKFIATVIFREGRLHYKAFIDELNRHLKRDFTIYLPACADGTPDFAYMDSYMRAKEASVLARLKLFNALADK